MHERRPRGERKALTEHYIEMVGLTHASDRRPASCRAACASASRWRGRWPWSPRCCCSTSRLSALDALTRAKLQDEIEAIWRPRRKTVVLITNDVDEAILLADRIIPLESRPGTLGPEFGRPAAPARPHRDEPRSRLQAAARRGHALPDGSGDSSARRRATRRRRCPM